MPKTHKMSYTKTYKSWEAMKARCFNKNNPKYKDYGERGIIICPDWLGNNGFENFYRDMGERPKNKSIDRINNDLDYYKSNCKWSSQKEQQNNKRSNVLITFNGKTQNIGQWAEELGIKYNTLWGRINKGWSVERALRIIIPKLKGTMIKSSSLKP